MLIIGRTCKIDRATAVKTICLSGIVEMFITSCCVIKLFGGDLFQVYNNVRKKKKQFIIYETEIFE